MTRDPSRDSRKLLIDTLARRVGAAAMLIAAAFWLWSAFIDVEGSLALAQAQIQWMADLNRYGSAAAVVAAICAMFMFLVKPETR